MWVWPLIPLNLHENQRTVGPPLSKKEKRALEDQRRKEGYEFLFGEPENPEAEEQKRKQRKKADKKRYEGYEDLFY